MDTTLMFSPVPPTKPQSVKLGLTDEMANEKGVSILIRGLGREGQWILKYSDPGRNLLFEFFAYRADDLDKIDGLFSEDFWRADLGYRLKEFVDRHSGSDAKALLQEVGANIAECLFRWPIERFNPAQAKRVRVSGLGIAILWFDLPEDWKRR